MKAMEITRELDFDTEQEASLDNHSLLNLLNIIQYNFLMLNNILPEGTSLMNLYGFVQDLAQRLSKKAFSPAEGEDVRRIQSQILSGVEEAVQLLHTEEEKKRADEMVDNIRSIVRILNCRLEDFEEKERRGLFAWLDYDTAALDQEQRDFLMAVEKNSGGRYRIVYNIAEKDENSYFVVVTINGVEPTKIRIPIVLKDVFRDLLANARKYTAPGGNILAGVFQDREMLVLTVEDTGRGIPKDSIEKVVGYGFRAHNVEDKHSYGGGFGLSKAYYVCKRLGGRMWVDSEEGRFTKIRMQIPC